MGFIIDGVDQFDYEERGESIVIHPKEGEDSNYPQYANQPHPEFLYEDLTELIEGLQYLQRRRADGNARKITIDLLTRGIPIELDKRGEMSFADLKALYTNVKAEMLDQAIRTLVARSAIKELSFGGLAYYSL